ncbi:MAG: hypothetical protein KDJ54_08105 [Candidatus Competibacteraceae bacterium]|nr:hypothetical protein [Candidatus Competibacteraceae bacterium]
MSRKDFEPMIGGRNQVSEVFFRKQSLTIHLIRRLSERLRRFASPT